MGLDERHCRYVFGPFCIQPDVGRLIRAGNPVPIAPKAFEILLLLASRPNEIISKEEIRAHVWHGTHVETKNIGVQIVAVRKALEDVPDEPRYVETVPRRGYRFIATVVKEEGLCEPLIDAAGRASVHANPTQRAWTRPVYLSIAFVLACATAFAFIVVRTHRRPSPDTNKFGIALPTLAMTANVTAETRALYERGKYFYSRGGPGSLQIALGYFTEAIRRDSGYADAYAAVATAYVILADAQHRAEEPLEHAEDAANTALRLNPRLADAWLALAVTRSELHWDWIGAESAYQRAVELDPTNATAHEWYGSFLALTGRTTRGLREAMQAVQIEPRSSSRHHTVGEILLYAGDCEEAINPLNSALEFNPKDEWSQYLLVRAHVCVSKKEPAASRLFFTKTVPHFEPPPLRDFGSAFEKSGPQGVGRAQLETFLAEDRVQSLDPVVLASAYAAVGEKANALDAIDRGFAEHASMLRQLAADPNFDVLRDEPRFEKVMASIRLPVFRHNSITLQE